MEFVVCDDEKVFRSNVVKIIDKIYMKNNEDYKIYEFDSYNKSFEKLINKKSPKIYILDIEIKNSISGIDIARKVRRYDWDSIIILVTSHNELGYQAMKAQIMLLDFVSKFDDCNKSLERAINKALELVNKKKVIKFDTSGATYIVYLSDILYIERDTVDRKCIIHTVNNIIPTSKSLNELSKELGSDFYLCHRSCLVNLLNIDYVIWKDSIVYFKNGTSMDLVSRDKKKGLKGYVNS